MNKETKLRIHNITAKAALKFVREAWVLKKREEQLLEAAQRHLLGITKVNLLNPPPHKIPGTPLADTHYNSSSSSYSKCAHIIFLSRGGGGVLN